MWRAIKVLVTVTAVCVLLSLTGCDIPIAGEGYDGPTTKLEGQDEAVRLVWQWTFGGDATVVSPPPIVWVRGQSCTDTDGNTWKGAFACVVSGGKGCCRGRYDIQGGYAQIEYPEDGKFSGVPLAHELCHAWYGFTHDDHDQNHDDLCFLGCPTSGEEPVGSLVHEANRRLKVVGQ